VHGHTEVPTGCSLQLYRTAAGYSLQLYRTAAGYSLQLYRAAAAAHATEVDADILSCCSMRALVAV
jgi:hypothetical protein